MSYFRSMPVPRISKFFQVSLLTITLFFFAFLITPNSIFAADTTSSTTNNTTAIDASNWHASQQANFSLITLLSALNTQVAGVPLIPGQVPVIEPDGSMRLADSLPNGGALGGLNTVIVAMLSTPPTSTAQYLADVGNNMGIIRTAYAQTSVGGSGEGVIRPVIRLWQVTRNFSYMMFIVIFLVVGFMIMFRQKINPQTVISAQAALPSLVIGLILVTFSYFIAALIVDLSFVGMMLVSYLFQQTGLSLYMSNQGMNDLARNSNVFGLFSSFIFSSATGDLPGYFAKLFTLSPENARTLGQALAGPGGGQIITNLPGVGPVIATKMGEIVSAGVGGVVGILVMLVVAIALFIQMFRLLLELIRAYISILVATIGGPLLILVSSIPGRSGALSLWWRALLGNVLVFPAIFLAFLFAGAILGNTGDFAQTLPLFSGLPVSLVRVMIGLGIVLGTPAIPGMVKSALKVPDIKGLPEAAIGGAAAGFGVVSGGARRGYDTATGSWKAQRDLYQKALAQQRASGGAGAVPGMGGVGGLKEWLFRRGLP